MRTRKLRRFAAAAAWLVSLWLAGSALAASILPFARQQFSDSNGLPLSGGFVCLYVPGTTTPKLTWQDRGQTTPNSSPCVTLDSSGRAAIWGYGQYREVLEDSSLNVIFDALVSDYVSDVQNNSFNWGGTSGGTLNAQTIVLTPALTAYAPGQVFKFIAGFTNSGAMTLNVSGLGAQPIEKITASGPQPMTGGEIAAGQIVDVTYDGSEFQLTSVTNVIPVRQTFSATITCGTGTIGAYTKQFGTYYKVASDAAIVNFDVQAAIGTCSGALTIGGLPFSTSATFDSTLSVYDLTTGLILQGYVATAATGAQIFTTVGGNPTGSDRFFVTGIVFL